MSERISLAVARRVALAAQGFDRLPPARPDLGHLRRTVDRLSLHQIDSVNVLVRAHYMPAFSRLGAYDRTLIDRVAWGRKSERRLFEYWAHEASLVPLDLHPLFRWRMARAARGEIGWAGVRFVAHEQRDLAMQIFGESRLKGHLLRRISTKDAVGPVGGNGARPSARLNGCFGQA